MADITKIKPLGSTTEYTLNARILGQTSSTTATDKGGLTWNNISGKQGTTINAYDTPSTTDTWWYILRNRHTNTTNNYYTDVAIPFNANSIYYKRVTGSTGSETIANASTNNGWVQVLDQLNYNNYAPTTKGVGASGTWDINITGTAAKATNDSDGNAINTTYLKKSGGTMTGNINRYYASASSNPMITALANNQDITLFTVGHGTAAGATTASNHYKLLYKGTGSSPNNYLQLIAHGSADKVAIQIDENANVSFTNTVNADISGNAVTATKFVSAQSITLTGDTTGTASSQAGWSITTTTDQLSYKPQITTLADLDAFGKIGINMKIAKVSALDGHTGTLTKNDGMILALPWSGGYGHQFYVDDNGYGLHHRYWYTHKVNDVDTVDFNNWVQILDSNNYANYTVKKDGTGATGTWEISITGNAATSTKTGVASMWTYSENSNELNFGGTNNSSNIFIGYRAKDSKPIPTKFIFGSSTGTADLQAKTVYLGSGTSSYISSTNYTGNAATVTVTKTTPTNTTTYYPTYTTSTTTGAQSLRNDTRFYYYDTGTTSYLNIGNTSNSGGLTLHNANGKYGDIVSSAFTANRTFTLPDKTGTFALTSDLNSYLPIYYNNLDFTSTAPTPGAYKMDAQTNPATGVVEYGSSLSLPGIATNTKHYASQLIISSASGQTSPAHAYIRRLTSTPAWSDWSTLLDNKNFDNYTVKKNSTNGTTSQVAYYTATNTIGGNNNFTWDATNNQVTVIHKSGKGDGFRTYHGTSVDMFFGIGSGDANHGIYDSKAGKWMIYADVNGNVTVNGNATSATKATQDSDGNTINTTYLKKSGGNITGNLNIEYNKQIVFYGKNNNTSPRAIMGYTNSMGGIMHCENTANHQTSGAFYISSNGCDGANDNGGIAIDNEGVTVFGAGDPGNNFTGVFRVINEDSVGTGPVFTVKKAGACYFGNGQTHYISNDGSQYTGNAATATALTTNAGSATQPVYFSGGKPVAATAYSGLLTALSWTGGTTAGPTLSITVGGTNKTATIPSATASASGIVTTGAQSFAGDKTFTSIVTTVGKNVIRSNESAPGQGDILLGALGLKTGYPVYTDPTFLSGTNSVGVYNNTSGGNVVHTRDTYSNFGVPSPGTNSNYIIKIENKGAASPGIGGFVQNISSRANAQFIQIFRALIPVGRNVITASNSMGTTYQDQWLTSQAGTGKWEWYARRVLCGQTGTFSSGGHVYLDGAAGTTDAPVVWYLAACNLYDITRMDYDGLRVRESDAVHDYNNGTLTTFGYSTSGMTSTSWLGSWDGYKLRAISPANAVKSGVGTTAIGSATKPVYWTGSAFAAITSYEGNAATATSISTTGGTAAKFWRGDNTWSDTISGGTLKITNNSNTITIGSQNSSWAHFENSANIPFYFNKRINAVHGFKVYGSNTQLEEGRLILDTAASNPSTSAGARIEFAYNNNGSQPVYISYTPNDSYRSPAGLKIMGGTSATPAWLEVEGQIYGARFNGPVTGNVTGTATNANYVNLYEARETTTTLNKSANYVGAGKMFHLVASSSTSATDNGKPPMGDANVLQMNWDNSGGYDAQLAISTAANRMEFRDQISTKKAWREVVTSTPGTAAGGQNLPVYISTTGVATAITSVGTAYGGTGNTSFTANRLVYSESATKLSSATSLYATTNAVGINTTSLSTPKIIENLANTQSTITPSFQVSGKSYHTDTLIIAPNKRAIEFRPDHASYSSYIYYGTAGNEALNFVNRNTVTSFLFWTGNSVNSSSQWYLQEDNTTARTDNPAIQIKKNSLYINKLLPTNSNPEYKLYINGTTCGSDTATFKTVVISSTGADQHLKFSRAGSWNYITVPFDNTSTVLSLNSSTGSANSFYQWNSTNYNPGTQYTKSLGENTLRWKAAFIGAFTIGNGDKDSIESKQISSNNTFYINRPTSSSIIFQHNSVNKIWIDTTNALRPETNNTLSIGTSSYKWKDMYATTFHGVLDGNATTATTLKNARTINGTSFNGSANITTANWGTARNITIGGTTKSVNGSTNYTWTNNEINRISIGSQLDHERVVIGLCELSAANTGIQSNWHGKIYRVRSNGLVPDYFADVDFNAAYSAANGFFYNLITDYENTGTTARSGEGYRACVFKYNNKYYGGLEFKQTQASAFYANGVGDFTPFAIAYYNDNTATVKDSEINDSISFATTQCIRQQTNGSFKGPLDGNAATATTATKLATSRTIALTGDVTGSGSFNGASNLSIATAVTLPYGASLPTTGTEGKVFLQTSAEYYELPTGGAIGQVLAKKTAADRSVEWINIPSRLNVTSSTDKFYPLGTTSDSNGTISTGVFNTSVYVENNVLFGAAWNDYAEFRQPIQGQLPTPGTCVIETGDDTLMISTERMQPGASIVSDTYGFAIGKTKKAICPIAVSGRVLAYTYEDREEFKKNIGRPVCAGPNGTVSIMTDEEYRNYGYCAIGTISAVPNYETWGENNIPVNNRVWIKVR